MTCSISSLTIRPGYTRIFTSPLQTNTEKNREQFFTLASILYSIQLLRQSWKSKRVRSLRMHLRLAEHPSNISMVKWANEQWLSKLISQLESCYHKIISHKNMFRNIWYMRLTFPESYSLLSHLYSIFIKCHLRKRPWNKNLMLLFIHMAIITWLHIMSILVIAWGRKIRITCSYFFADFKLKKVQNQMLLKCTTIRAGAIKSRYS